MSKRTSRQRHDRWFSVLYNLRYAFIGLSLIGFSVIGSILLRDSQAATNGYNPDPYCYGTVVGYIFADGRMPGDTWNKNASTWNLDVSGAPKTRFLRCANVIRNSTYVVNPGAAQVEDLSSGVRLSNYQFVGGLDNHHLSTIITEGSAFMRRAFLMAVMELDGPGTNGLRDNPTKIYDHTWSDFPKGDTETGLKRIEFRNVAKTLLPSVAYYNSGNNSCVDKTDAQVLASNSGTICISSDDWPIMRDWPFTRCNRVPGYRDADAGQYNCNGTDQASGSSGNTAPDITMSASPTTITSGDSFTLTWSVEGTPAPTCNASGGWGGSRTLANTKSYAPTETTTYTLTCNNSAGPDSASVTVTVNAPPPDDTAAPNISLPATIVNDAVLFGTVSFEVPASDASGIDRAEMLVDGSIVLTDNTAPYNFDWDTGGLSIGSHQLQIKVYDKASPQNVAVRNRTLLIAANSCGASKRADVNCDGNVDIVDLSDIIGLWEQSISPNNDSDIVRDGRINIFDLSAFIAAFGPAPLL